MRKKSFLFAFATPQAPAPRKTERDTTQGSNQRLTAPLNSSCGPVSNTVWGSHFTTEPGQAGNTLEIETSYTLISTTNSNR